jgi:hypothetical protein
MLGRFNASNEKALTEPRMQDSSSTAPTRVVVLDLVSLVLLAVAAGLAFGIVLAGMTLLFASGTVRAGTPATPTGGAVIERPVEQPTGNPRLPAAPVQPGVRTPGTMV